MGNMTTEDRLETRDGLKIWKKHPKGCSCHGCIRGRTLAEKSMKKIKKDIKEI